MKDLSNFHVNFSILDTLKSVVVSLENILLKVNRLDETCKIHEMNFDPAMRKYHVMLRVSDGTEETVRMQTNEDNTLFEIEPLTNIRPKDFSEILTQLIWAFNRINLDQPSTKIKSMMTRHNKLTITFPNSVPLTPLSAPLPPVAERAEEPIEPKKERHFGSPRDSKLMIIDGNSMLHRAYYVTAYKKQESELEKDEKGRFIGACKVFMELLGKYMKVYMPTHLVVTWDHPDEDLPTFRHTLYNGYKSHREEKPMPYIEQRATLLGMLEEMNIFQIYDESGTYEADDLIGTIAKKIWRASYPDGDIFIVSNDKDLFQLLDDHTYQLMKIKKEDVCFSLQAFTEQYGISPTAFIDAKAILGDSSDGYTGILGVGEKAVFPLLQQYQSLENILDNLPEIESGAYKRYTSKFLEGKDDGLLCKRLATIVTDVDIPPITETDDMKLKIDKEKKNIIFKQLGFF